MSRGHAWRKITDSQLAATFTISHNSWPNWRTFIQGSWIDCQDEGGGISSYALHSRQLRIVINVHLYKQRDHIDNGTTLFYFSFLCFRKKRKKLFLRGVTQKVCSPPNENSRRFKTKNKKMGVAVGWLVVFFFFFSACISQINTPGALLVAIECSTSLITIAHYMQFIVNVSTRIEREMSGRCARNVRLAATMHTNESVYRNARNRFGYQRIRQQLGRERNSIWPELCSSTEGMNYFWFDFVFSLLHATDYGWYGSSLRPATPNIFGSVSKWQEPRAVLCTEFH